MLLWTVTPEGSRSLPQRPRNFSNASDSGRLRQPHNDALALDLNAQSTPSCRSSINRPVVGDHDRGKRCIDGHRQRQQALPRLAPPIVDLLGTAFKTATGSSNQDGLQAPLTLMSSDRSSIVSTVLSKGLFYPTADAAASAIRRVMEHRLRFICGLEGEPCCRNRPAPRSRACDERGRRFCRRLSGSAVLSIDIPSVASPIVRPRHLYRALDS